jgi:CubicO group peptidase (beta-lactamase class C family)
MLVILLLFVPLPLVFAADAVDEAGRMAVIDFMVQDAIRRHQISGGVLLIGNKNGVLYETAYGKAGFEPDAKQLQVDALFDVASLTKVVATAPSIVKLLDEGKLSLLDPLGRWFPEFDGRNITVLNLLTHTSGLHDFNLDRESTLQKAIERAAAQPCISQPGTRFLYADINFILLGELVRRISGKRLDLYSTEMIYRPLRMNTTGFNPKTDIQTASTMGRGKVPQTGVVQDENAQRLGGVAGHAGLFSTARDLSRFASALLSDGELDGKRVLSNRAVAQMTAPYYFSGGRIVRGLGWDRESPFSAAKGTLFSEVSYGHTGYSGSSIWLDPATDLYVVFLTTRLDYKNIKSFNKLRGDIATLAAAVFSGRTAGRLMEPFLERNP